MNKSISLIHSRKAISTGNKFFQAASFEINRESAGAYPFS